MAPFTQYTRKSCLNLHYEAQLLACFYIPLQCSACVNDKKKKAKYIPVCANPKSHKKNGQYIVELDTSNNYQFALFEDQNKILGREPLFYGPAKYKLKTKGTRDCKWWNPSKEQTSVGEKRTQSSRV